jgi:hypothetical protein
MRNYNVNPAVDYLRTLTNIHRPGLLPNIFIFSLPRSGSTWLMELIWSQPGFKYCNEPLNLKEPWMWRNSGIKGFEELYTDRVRDKLIGYFKDVCNGKKHFLDPSPMRSYYRLFTNRIVFKIIHGGEKYISDISSACNGKIIYLLRHPIPVALSRKVLPRMEQLCSDFVLGSFSENEKEYALKLNHEGNEMERRILAWCLQNKLALMGRKNDWIVITYEQLTIDPRPVIQKISTELHLPDPERMYKQLSIPSAVSVQSENDSVNLMRTNDGDRHGLINRWQQKVKPEEAEHLMMICSKFDLNMYSSSSPLPHESWLLK